MLYTQNLNFFINKSINIYKERVINFYYYILKTATLREDNFHLKVDIDLIRTINSEVQTK